VIVGTRRSDANGGLLEVFDDAATVIDLDGAEYFDSRISRTTPTLCSRLRLRVKEQAPLVALRHVTDGTATWTHPIVSKGLVLPTDPRAASTRRCTRW
jgi:hypothetical protein